MPNRLAESSSPYLRQHQENPVDWFPWCDAAFDQARSQDKAIFLSVGYSACHWCHVMEHESFENDDIAAILNEHFVSIKVDREERPDVDQIYMQAVQMLTGSGGWPMSVFMSPDGRPFYAGTYWPPDSRWGRPGFGQVLLAVADAWKNKRAEIDEQSAQITQHLQVACRGPQADKELSPDWITAADRWLISHHDSEHGGFGGAPKFPHSMDLALLIELETTDPNPARGAAIRNTLDCMYRGGIYDHLGGGFSRYSVDERWLVPHFEKMLYDNALLAGVYADAYRRWHDELYADVARETLDYIIRDMTNELGGYHSSEDADSQGVEGKFYVWIPSEVLAILGPERGQQFCDCFDVSTPGNFEGASILNLRQSVEQFAQSRGVKASRGLDSSAIKLQLAEDKSKLLAAREKRVRPGLDDKVILSWNALMISGMARGYRATGESRFLESAQRAVRFITSEMRGDDGRYWHTWRAGKASLDAYLDDYAYLIDALVELFQVDCRAVYLTHAIELADRLIQDFSDPEGGFFFTANGHEQLIAKSKDLADSSVPSGNAMAASGLLTLARLTSREDYMQAARSALLATSGVMSSSPQAAGQSLRVLNRILHPGEETVLLLGQDDQHEFESVAAKFRQRLRPHSVQLTHMGNAPAELQALCPLLAERQPIGGRTTLYVCENAVCQPPLTAQELKNYMG